MTTQLSVPTPTNEVTVNLVTGEAFISQTKAAAELGIARSSLQKWLVKEQVKYDVKQGLSSEILALAAGYYALDSAAATPEAKELLRKISQAGAKAWLYHEAGYAVSASPVKPMALPEDYVSALRALADATEQKIMLLEENTEKRIITDEGEEYFSAKRIKELNPDAKIGGVKLARSAAKLGIAAKPMFDHYDFANPVTWHVSVWLDAYPQLNYPE